MNDPIKTTVTLTQPARLLTQSYYRRLWLAARNIKITRRDWLDELADTFRDFDGRILTPNGQPYDLPFIDDAFGDDPEVRWMGHYLTPDTSGLYPKIHSKKIERLQLLDLYFKIKHPDIAAHFER